MKYAIVFSSNSGNTRMLAECIQENLNSEDCIYYGQPNTEALAADRLYVGFWTDKGTCDGPIKEFLSLLRDKEVFIFGTAGFGGDDLYFKRILSTVSAHMDSSVTVIGTYMCQGKMPLTVKHRYEKMLDAPNPSQHIVGMLENFEKALSHPDEQDLERLKEVVL